MDHGSPSSDVPTEDSFDGQLTEWPQSDITDPNHPALQRGRSVQRSSAAAQTNEHIGEPGDIDRTAQYSIGVCTLRDVTNTSSKDGEPSGSGTNTRRASASTAEYILITLVLNTSKQLEHLVQIQPKCFFGTLAGMARRQWRDIIPEGALIQLKNQRNGRVSGSGKVLWLQC